MPACYVSAGSHLELYTFKATEPSAQALGWVLLKNKHGGFVSEMGSSYLRL